MKPVPALKLGPWIETASGEVFNLYAPKFTIEDIGHGLSHLCRYSGQCRQFYSVAEHSVLVSEIMRHLGLGSPLEGLLHDATEAYISDIASPWKTLLPDYVLLEERLEFVMRAHFNLPSTMTAECRFADQVALVLEARVLLPSKGADWGFPPGVVAQADQLTFNIKCMHPLAARSAFWKRYEELS